MLSCWHEEIPPGVGGRLGYGARGIGGFRAHGEPGCAAAERSGIRRGASGSRAGRQRLHLFSRSDESPGGNDQPSVGFRFPDGPGAGERRAARMDLGKRGVPRAGEARNRMRDLPGAAGGDHRDPGAVRQSVVAHAGRAGSAGAPGAPGRAIRGGDGRSGRRPALRRFGPERRVQPHRLSGGLGDFLLVGGIGDGAGPRSGRAAGNAGATGCGTGNDRAVRRRIGAGDENGASDGVQRRGRPLRQAGSNGIVCLHRLEHQSGVGAVAESPVFFQTQPNQTGFGRGPSVHDRSSNADLC